MNKIVEIITNVNDAVNGAVWGLPGLILLIGVLALFPLVLKITKNYVDRKIKGKDVAPMLSYDPELQAEAEARPDDE